MRALASTTSSLQARNSSAELLTLTSAWEIGGTKCGKATHNEKSDSSRILYRQRTFYFCEKKSSFMYWSKERRRRIRRTTLLQTREFLFLGQKYQSKNHDEARQDFSQKKWYFAAVVGLVAPSVLSCLLAFQLQNQLMFHKAVKHVEQSRNMKII